MLPLLLIQLTSGPAIIVVIRELHVDGSYAPVVNVAGSYEAAVNLDGSWHPAINVDGSMEQP